MKFLHCADLHLGCPNGGERMRAYLNMMDFCVREQVGVLLVAGDLFDSPRVDEKTLRMTFEKMAACPSLCVMIAAGNHDPKRKGGNFDRPLPGNIYVFPAGWTAAEIPAYGVRVWGGSFISEKEGAFLPEQKKLKLRQELIDIGVLHGDLTTAGASSEYRAVSPEAIAQTGLTYLALGHIHQRSPIRRAGGTLYAYSGCLQGMGFDEPGEKGAYLGTLSKDGLEMAFVRLCGSMTLEETLDVTGCHNAAEAAARYAQRIGAKEGHRVLLTLSGTRDDGFSPAQLPLLLKGQAAEIRVEDETRRALNLVQLEQEGTLRGAFVRGMQRRISGAQTAEEASRAQLALKLGLDAFEGEVSSDAD